MQSSEALRVLTEKIVNQQKTRPIMCEHDTPYAVAQMLAQEANELVEAMYNDLDGSAWEIISELADVMYLWLYLAQMLDVDAVDAVEMKLDRNSEKHHERFYQSGDYLEQSSGRAGGSPPSE